jgi:hypothetical protein
VSDVQKLDLLRRVLREVPAEQLARSVVVVDERSIRVTTLPIVPSG